MSDLKLYSTGWNDYELIDAGGGKKLERWGTIITIRPEVQAYFRSEKTHVEWKQLAHWEFIPKGSQSGSWKALKKDAPREWTIKYNRLKFHLKLTKFKHVGLFPEQRVNWDFIDERNQIFESFCIHRRGLACCALQRRGDHTCRFRKAIDLVGERKHGSEQLAQYPMGTRRRLEIFRTGSEA
jgi:hypothetical protein